MSVTLSITKGSFFRPLSFQRVFHELKTVEYNTSQQAIFLIQFKLIPLSKLCQRANLDSSYTRSTTCSVSWQFPGDQLTGRNPNTKNSISSQYFFNLRMKKLTYKVHIMILTYMTYKGDFWKVSFFFELLQKFKSSVYF